MRYQSWLCTVLVMLCVTTGYVTARAGDIVITRQQIDRGQNVVVVSMPCNWLPATPIELRGLYGHHLESRVLSLSIADSDGDKSVKVTVDPIEKEGLSELWITYAETRRRCKEKFGFDALSK